MRRILKAGNRLIERLVIVLFAGIVGIGALQIFNRFVLNQPLSWTEEAQRFAFIWLVFLAIPLASEKGMHIGVDILTQRMSGAAQRRLALLVDVLWVSLSGIVVFVSWPLIRVARFQISPALELPMSLVYAVIPLAFTWIAVLAMVRIGKNLSGPDS